VGCWPSGPKAACLTLYEREILHGLVITLRPNRPHGIMQSYQFVQKCVGLTGVSLYVTQLFCSYLDVFSAWNSAIFIMPRPPDTMKMMMMIGQSGWTLLYRGTVWLRKAAAGGKCLDSGGGFVYVCGLKTSGWWRSCVCTWAQDERPADLHMAQPNV
jgi:hypothetical protein